MPTESTEATSPASSGDAKKEGSGNLTQGQAAARLFANQAETAPTAPPQSATEETTPGKPEETPAAPVAEAPAASVETEIDDDANAVETSAPAEPEIEADSVPSHTTSTFTPEQQKIFDKRLGKEIGKRTALETKIAAMEARQAELEAKLIEPAAATPDPVATPPVPITGPQPLSDLNDLASLGALQQQAKSAVRWAEETLDTPKAWKTRIDTDPDTGEETSVRVTANGDKTFTEAEVKGIMRNAKLTLEDKIPQRAQFVQMRDRAQTAARKEFPFLTDKKSPEYQQAQQMLRDPWVQMRADAEWIVGMQLRGMKALEADRAAAKAAVDPKPKPKAAAKPSSDQSAVSSTATTARVPITTSAKQALVAEQQKLSKKGGISTAEAIASLQNRERIRNSR